MTDTLTPVLSADWDDDRAWTLAATSGTAGTRALARRWSSHPTAVIEMVKDSGLRGRGGAGFPTGMKWGFIPQGRRQAALPGRQRRRVRAGHLQGHSADDGVPHALRRRRHHLVLRDQRQPRVHLRARRGAARRPPAAARGRRRRTLAGHLGKNIHGSGYDLDLVIHAGAGAYICGEETALLDSLEGRRGQPRLRPPFPAVAGLYACADGDQQRRDDRVSAVHRDHGRGLVQLDGHREDARAMTLTRCRDTSTKPGQYEAPLGITLRELIDLAGGVRRRATS